MRGVVLWVAGFGAACAASQTEAELSQLRRQVRVLTSGMDDARKDIDVLTQRVALMSAGRSIAHEATAPAIEVRTDPSKRREPGLPVVRLGADARPEVSGEDDTDPGALDDGGPPLLIRLGPGDSADRLTVDHDVLAKPDPVLGQPKNAPARQDPGAEYSRALELLRDKKRPNEARTLLSGFLKKYPKSHLIDNAAYWLAECSYAEGNHPRAIAEFERVAAAYPSSAKVPDAWFRVAESWVALGNREKASEIFRRVVEKYPNSDAAPRARARLDAKDTR